MPNIFRPPTASSAQRAANAPTYLGELVADTVTGALYVAQSLGAALVWVEQGAGGGGGVGGVSTDAGNLATLGTDGGILVDADHVTPAAIGAEVAGAAAAITLSGLGGVASNDSRLSDARTPTAHKTSHATGGSDALTADDVGAATAGHTHSGVYEPTQSAASQVEAEAGTESAIRSWSPLRVAQAIQALTAASGAAGTKTLRVFTPLDNNPPATAFATLDTRNSIALLDFDAATNESAVFHGIIPQGANLASGILVRIAWMATSATSGNTAWGAQWEKIGTDYDADSFDTATTAFTACSGTSGIAVWTEITCTTINSLAAGDFYRLKIYRNATDATNDTMAGDAELIAVEVQQVA